MINHKQEVTFFGLTGSGATYYLQIRNHNFKHVN